MKRRFDQLIPTSSKDALMVRKAVEEVHQKLKNISYSAQRYAKMTKPKMASNTLVEYIKEEDYEGLPIHQLPVEIVLMIFDELSLKDILQVEKVCKR